MTQFLRWLTLTHSQRLHAHRHTTGYGHIYQGRFKSFRVEQDQAALNVTRYVERNALRAHLVDKAQNWRWYSLWRRVHGYRESLLSDWPFDRPADWIEWVNTAQTEAEIEALRKCVNRGTPYGTEAWKTQIAATLGLKFRLQPRGRPRKQLALTNTQTLKRFSTAVIISFVQASATAALQAVGK